MPLVAPRYTRKPARNAAHNGQPSTSAQMTSTPQPMNQFLTFRSAQRSALLLCIPALVACGAGSSTPTSPVTSITASGAAYGKSTTFTINGTNLPATVTPTVTGCSSLTLISSTSATSRQFTCVPESVSVAVTVATAGNPSFTTTLAVPRPNVTFVTSSGSIIVELYPEYSPLSVKNFMAYVNSGFYSNTIFHRVISGFMNQGGGFVANSDGTISQKTATFAPIALESNNGLSNLKYTLAMARTNSPDSATSQFYLNALDNTFLDYKSTTAGANGYAVFGKAIAGTALIDSINKVATTSKVVSPGTSSMTDVPVTTITLQSATQTQ